MNPADIRHAASAGTMGCMAFTGIPKGAVDFYRQLEDNNSRDWFQAHKQDYLDQVRTPFEALAEDVGAAFGEAKVYRPNRDVRFSSDKSPYKTHQGLYVRSNSHAGWYFNLDSSGFFLGGGSYWFAPDQLVRYRTAVANDHSGAELKSILAELTAAGYEVGGEQVATRPRGVPSDAPRLDLLRRKALTVRLVLGEPAWMATPDAAEYLHDGWDEVRPLVSWLHQFVGDSEQRRS